MWVQATDLKFYFGATFENNKGAVIISDIPEVISFYPTAGANALRSLLKDFGINGKLIGEISSEKNLHRTRGLIDCQVSEFVLRDTIPIPDDYEHSTDLLNWDSDMIGFLTWYSLESVRAHIHGCIYDRMLTRIMTGDPFGNDKLTKSRLKRAIKSSPVSNNLILLEWKK